MEVICTELRKIIHNKLFYSSYTYHPFRRISKKVCLKCHKGISEFSNSFYWCRWSGLLDGCSVNFGFFLPGEEVVCSACCGDDSSFLHFTDTEHLAAMQGETWVLTEITMKLHKSSPSKKNQLFFFFYRRSHDKKKSTLFSRHSDTYVETK